uniref:Kelch like family member 10 n=1 Tax=Amphiprion percula TaxID=161767 RepID=A0A3P8ST07_AMPPE
MNECSEPPHKLSVFNELRLNGEFCDAVIKVEDVAFQIHKVILCNCTPYFRALFSHCSDPLVINIAGLSPDMMQLIIDFAYTGSVSVTKDNVQDLLLAADQLNVMGVIQACCSFLGEQLCPQNCIGIWRFTNICVSPELQHKAHHCITDRFEEVVSCEEFLQLSAQELADILDRDDLNVRWERCVFEAVMRWIDHEPEERQRHLAALLSKVRLALMTMDDIRITVLSNELVQNNAECMTLVNDAIAILPNQHRYYNCPARPRLPNAILFATGGFSGDDLTHVTEVYNVRTDDWITVTDSLQHPRAYHGTVFLNGYIYCIGGRDRTEKFNSVCRFDLRAHTWQEVAPMYFRRCYVSVTVLNGIIYAMGGFDGHDRLSTAECYQPETNQWSVIASMHEQRSDASCTALHEKIYICGGLNGFECLQTAECYNPKTNQWTVIAPMNFRRSGTGVVTYADHIYAVGGFDGSSRLRSAEAYNPQTDAWTTVSSMITPRSNFGIEVIDSRIFVVGGFNGTTTTFNVECYDATKNQWSQACDMDVSRSALSCCVVSGLPNITEYATPREVLQLLHFEEDAMESDDFIPIF